MSRLVNVGKEAAVGPGRAKRVYIGDRRIAVFNDRGTSHAVDDACTHVGGPLSEGLCEDGVVTCPWHGARYRLRDGQGLDIESDKRSLRVDCRADNSGTRDGADDRAEEHRMAFNPRPLRRTPQLTPCEQHGLL